MGNPIKREILHIIGPKICTDEISTIASFFNFGGVMLGRSIPINPSKFRSGPIYIRLIRITHLRQNT